MKIFQVTMLLALLLAGCAPSSAPNGMSWDDFSAAKYQLVVTHNAEGVPGCKELGVVRGTAYDDGLAAKDSAEEQAVLMGGDTLLYTNLWTEWKPGSLIEIQREIHHADGTVYRCSELNPRSSNP